MINLNDTADDLRAICTAVAPLEVLTFRIKAMPLLYLRMCLLVSWPAGARPAPVSSATGEKPIAKPEEKKAETPEKGKK